MIMNTGLRVVGCICVSLITTQVVAADMSGWSDKTVCRIVKSGGNSDVNDEAILRDLECAASITSIKSYRSTNPSAVNRGIFGKAKRSLNKAPHGYTVISDPTTNAPTKLVEVFEVRPGDCYKNPGVNGWDDCSHDRERSELTENNSKPNRHGSDYWYGWSIYFPEDYINIYPTKTALGQFHQKDSDPIWMFHNADRAGGYKVVGTVGNLLKTKQTLISEEDLRGQWHKIEVHAKWSRSDTGVFQVWVNGELKLDYKGRTMTAKQVYFKYGVYRSYMVNYKAENKTSEVPAQTVYYSNVKKSHAREGLAAQLKD
jgi:hypothetical protein